MPAPHPLPRPHPGAPPDMAAWGMEGVRSKVRSGRTSPWHWAERPCALQKPLLGLRGKAWTHGHQIGSSLTQSWAHLPLSFLHGICPPGPDVQTTCPAVDFPLIPSCNLAALTVSLLWPAQLATPIRRCLCFMNPRPKSRLPPNLGVLPKSKPHQHGSAPAPA